MGRINTPDDVDYISHDIEYQLPDGSTTIWLNEYVDGMVQAERERIIKLLEEQVCDCHNVYCDKWATSVLEPLIVLIKEETND